MKVLSFVTKERSDRMCKILKELQGKSAQQILEENNISLSPPIDLYLLLERLHISALGEDFSDIENAVGYEQGEILGAAISKDELLTIFYRKSDSENRKRFTIAHELGHCALHTENLKAEHVELRKNSNSEDYREKSANIFAGELLIPEKSLKEIYGRLLNPSLSVLAQVFKVSTNVMEARLDHLALPYFKDTYYTNV